MDTDATEGRVATRSGGRDEVTAAREDVKVVAGAGVVKAGVGLMAVGGVGRCGGDAMRIETVEGAEKPPYLY